jgi:hypothetical protein
LATLARVARLIDRILARALADLREIVEVHWLQSGSAGEKAKTLGVSAGHYWRFKHAISPVPSWW